MLHLNIRLEPRPQLCLRQATCSRFPAPSRHLLSPLSYPCQPQPIWKTIFNLQTAQEVHARHFPCRRGTRGHQDVCTRIFTTALFMAHETGDDLRVHREVTGSINRVGGKIESHQEGARRLVLIGKGLTAVRQRKIRA